MRGAASLAVASLTLAVGCGGGSTESKPLVTYHQSGTIVGLDDRLTVDEAGHAMLADRQKRERSFDLPAATRDRLESAVEAARFSTLRAEYRRPGGAIPDSVQYSVTHAGRTVQVSGGAEIPPALEHLAGLLQQLVEENRPT